MKQINKVTVFSSARVHINSLKMNQAGGRGCGGLGLTVDQPALEIDFKANKEIKINSIKDNLLQEKVGGYAKKILKAIGADSGVCLDFKQTFPTHIGLGSGTQLALAIGQGISMLNGKNLGIKEIACLMGRGGVSGIGYYTYLYGGFVVDGGYKMGLTEQKKSFSDHAMTPPPLIAHYNFPLKWKILLIIPPDDFRVKIDENKLFDDNTPVQLDEAEAICTDTLMGLVPALLEKDYFKFIEYLFDIIRFGTKKIELEINNTTINKVMAAIGGLLVFSWRRLRSCDFILEKPEDKIKKLSLYYPKNRYDLKKHYSENLKIKYPKNKVPFLGISSLGPTMYSFLLEGYHDLDKIKLEIEEKLGENWTIKIANVRNTPAKYTQ